MKGFSIGYNHDPIGFGRVLERYREHVYEVFFPCDPALAPTARPFPASYSHEQVETVVARAHDLGIHCNLLLNGEWTPIELYGEDHLARQIDALRRLVRLGVTSFTIRNTHLLADDVYREALGVRVENSINLHLDTLEGALFAVRHLHLDTIVWDRPLNRDVQALRRFVSVVSREHPQVLHKILLNEGCLPRCPFKTDHDCLVAQSVFAGEEHRRYLESVEEGSVERGLARFAHRCAGLVRDSPALFLEMPIVYPRQATEYAFVDVWKLDTRARSSQSIAALLEAYISGRDEELFRQFWNDALADALYEAVPDEYYRRTLTCRNACYDCGFCDEIAAGLLRKQSTQSRRGAEK
jgi:collagenase-like PrtC family protease